MVVIHVQLRGRVHKMNWKHHPRTGKTNGIDQLWTWKALKRKFEIFLCVRILTFGYRLPEGPKTDATHVPVAGQLQLFRRNWRPLRSSELLPRHLMDLTCSRQILLIRRFTSRTLTNSWAWCLSSDEASIFVGPVTVTKKSSAYWIILVPLNTLMWGEWVYMLKRNGLKAKPWGMPLYTSVASSSRISFLIIQTDKSMGAWMDWKTLSRMVKFNHSYEFFMSKETEIWKRQSLMQKVVDSISTGIGH